MSEREIYAVNIETPRGKSIVYSKDKECACDVGMTMIQKEGGEVKLTPMPKEFGEMTFNELLEDDSAEFMMIFKK